MHKNITLTPQELEELKDDIKFKTTVVLSLKQLKEIPAKVTSLGIHSMIHGWLIFLLISSIIGLAFFSLRSSV